MSNECDAILEQVPAYCAGELDAEESARFESALPACAEAADEVAQYRHMMLSLLHAAPQVAAPASARARLLDALDDTLAISAPAAPAPASDAAQVWAAPPPESKPTQPRPPQRRELLQQASAGSSGVARASQWLWSPRAASLLAACVVLLLGVTTLLLMRISALERQVQRETASLVSELGSGALSRVELLSTSGVEGQEGRMAWVATPDGEAWVTWLVVENLPPLAAGEVYQLWLAREDEAPLSIGRFRTDAETTAFVFVIGEPIEAYDRAYVTSEPADASAPSSEPIIAANL